MQSFRRLVHGVPSLEEQRLDAWVTTVGHYVCNDYSAALRTRTRTLLGYCTKGGGKLRFGETTYAFGAGDLMVQPAHVAHTCCSDADEGWEVWWLIMGGSYAYKLLQMIGLRPALPILSIGHHDQLTLHFESIYAQISEKTVHSHIESSRLLVSLLMEIMKLQKDKMFGELAPFQHIHYQSESVEQMAKAAGYSKFHFIRLFKKATGMTPWNYVLHLKIDKAKDLLLESNQSIKEVSVLVGFHNPLYFSRIFKQFTGSSPKQFRVEGQEDSYM